MTPEQIAHYLSVCEREDRDALNFCRDYYGAAWELAAAEIGYWHEHRRIEPYFQCLQSVEEVNGGLIYVHREPAKLQ